jgi:hypothetical protein
MDKKTERNIITVLVLILIVLGLSGCAKKNIEADHPKQPKLLETISNIPSISIAIGCVFAPWSEECKKDKKDKPHQTQDEYLDEVNKEFDNLDEELESGNTK